MLSKIEENYLRAIYKVLEKHGSPASTNHVAKELETSAASVTDMMKRLSDKGYLAYERYRGVTLTEHGYKYARAIIRRHRIWEVFLYDKLKYTNRDILKGLLKQLNYLRADDIVDRLDEYLNYPKVNFEGFAIPDKEGEYEHRSQFALSDMDTNEDGILVGIEDLSDDFFNFINKLELKLGSRIRIIERYSFDESLKVIIEGKNEHIITSKVASSLIMKKAPKK